MADPKDDITVEVGLSLDKDDVAKVTAQLKALTKAISDGNKIQKAHHDLQEKIRKNAEATTKRLKAQADQAKKLDDKIKLLNRSLHKINGLTKTFGNFVKKYALGSIMALTKAIKPALLGMAALGAGFLAAKVAVVATDLAVRAWNVTLKALPAAVAVGLGAVAAFTAAIAEVQAAANLPFYRQAGGQTQAGLANIYNTLLGDPQTAMLGAQSITATTNALMQAKVPLGQINETVKGLGGLGFYAGGGDAAAGLSNIVGAISEIGKDKNVTMSAQELERLAASFGPMSDTIKEVGKEYVGKDFQEFVAFLSSSPDELGDFANGLDAANGTLIGMLKTVKGTAQAALKPFGDQIVDMTKGPLAEFNDGLTGFINSVMPSVVVFFNRLLPAAFENLGNVLSWFDSFMRESLPSMVDGFREGYDTVRTFFQGTGAAIKAVWPFVQRISEGFDILFQTILGPVIGGIGTMFGGALVELTDFFEQNRATMASIGETIAGVFASDGFVAKTIKSGAKAIATLIDSLGPVVLKMIDYLEAPFYLFDIINDNKDALDEMAAGLEYFVEKAFGPFFDFVVRIIEFVVKSGPDIADIFRVAADLLDPMIQLASTLLDVLETLGGIKTVFAFLIGKAVLSGIMALGGAMGMAGAQGGVLAALFGSGAGGITRTGLTRRGVMTRGIGAAAGFGLAAAGMTIDDPLASGLVSGGGMFAGAGMSLAAMGMANPATLTLAAIGAGGYGVYNYFRARQRRDEADYADGGLRAQGFINSLSIDASPTNAQARASLDQFVRPMPTNFATIPTSGGDIGEGEIGVYLNRLAQYDPAAIDQFALQFGIDNLDDLVQREIEIESRKPLSNQNDMALMRAQAIQRYSIGQSDTLQREMKGFISSSAGGALAAQSEGVEMQTNMNKALEFMTEQLQLSETAALELADAAGLDLTKSTSDLTLAFAYLNDELANAQSAAQIFQGAFDQYVFEPLRAMEFDAELKSLGGIIEGSITEGGMVFGPDNPLALFIGRTLESIPMEIMRQLSSGAINSEEAINLTGSMFDEVLADVTDPVAKDAILAFKNNVLTAITEGEGLVNAEAERLASVLNTVVDAVDLNATDVIDGLGTKAKEVLDSLGITGDEPGDTASPKSNLMRTMGTHSMIDAMISGNRQVTSGYRTHNLGSSNSDHVNGLALDITGDNLGAYATAMRSAGGFAELHGSGSSRHLHVVPPMGDTPSPQAPMLPSLGQRNTGKAARVTNNITVNPAPGMSEAVLAKAVAREIGRMNTDAMERS